MDFYDEQSSNCVDVSTGGPRRDAWPFARQRGVSFDSSWHQSQQLRKTSYKFYSVVFIAHLLDNLRCS